jgi:hypothetical protein
MEGLGVKMAIGAVIAEGVAGGFPQLTEHVADGVYQKLAYPNVTKISHLLCS